MDGLTHTKQLLNLLFIVYIKMITIVDTLTSMSKIILMLISMEHVSSLIIFSHGSLMIGEFYYSIFHKKQEEEL